MPRIVEIVIRGNDQSEPAFASAATNLARLTSAGQAGQSSMLQFGAVAQNTGQQAALGLARVENQAHETGAAIITLGIAGSTTQTRMRSLNVVILNQEDRLQLLGQVLRETAADHDADSVAVRRATNAYNALNRTLENNYARLRDLRTSGDVSGISVHAGGGGGGALGPLAGGLGSLKSAAGMLGLAYGIQEVAQFGMAAIRASNDVERTQTTIRALSGSVERYNEIVALARENQLKFGGTTQENLESFRALIPVTNALNVEIADLDQTRRLLGAYQPESAQEAGRAIREFLTGTGGEASQSLQMIFELDKRRLDAIVAGTDNATERNRLLREELARIGVTERLITDQVNTRAAAYDRLGAAATNAKEAVGGLLGNLLLPTARAATGLLNVVSGIATGDLSSIKTGASQYLQLDQFASSPMMTGPRSTARMRGVGYDTTQPSVVNNITVQGSLVTERQVAATTRRLNAQTASRNGGSVRR